MNYLYQEEVLNLKWIIANIPIGSLVSIKKLNNSYIEPIGWKLPNAKVRSLNALPLVPVFLGPEEQLIFLGSVEVRQDADGIKYTSKVKKPVFYHSIEGPVYIDDTTGEWEISVINDSATLNVDDVQTLL